MQFWIGSFGGFSAIQLGGLNQSWSDAIVWNARPVDKGDSGIPPGAARGLTEFWFSIVTLLVSDCCSANKLYRTDPFGNISA